ncbi:MAG: hypothetical protein V2A79_05735 [Planctomycetota bacterium]
MDIPPLEAHSVAEAHLYLMATPCKLCGAGRTRSMGNRAESSAGRHVLLLHTRCEACGFDSEFRFSLPDQALPTQGDDVDWTAARINPGGAPSKIIDVAQWLTLFRVISEAAAAQTDAAESRRLGYEAAQCLEEALKFYREDSNLPRPESLLHEQSRRQLRERPDLFARARLINLRAKLPTLTEMEHRLESSGHRRPRKWWKLW